MLKRLCDRWFGVLDRLVKLVVDLNLAVRQYQTSWIKLLRRLAYLKCHGGFRPREALQDGLLDMRVPESALAATVAKRTLVELQARVNPGRFVCLTEDKAIFYAYCGALGLPVPRLFGVVTRPASFSATGQPLCDPADWRSFVASLPDQFVVKPSQGVYGRGVEIFRRDEGGFTGSLSGRHAAETMNNAFFTDARYSRFVVQERLRTHQRLQELSGTPYLQTVRMVTHVDDQGVCRVSCAFLRIITGEAVVDNFDGGRYGNLLSLVELSSGTLEIAVGAAPDGIGIVRIPQHPRTGILFQDFRLPDWEAACALVTRAAILFLPMRTLGWDIALTSDGPRIVEANEQWDPCNELIANTEKSAMRERLVELLTKLRRASHR
jgi:hypothetical protein